MSDLEYTIRRISDKLNESLREPYRKIRVEYSKSGGRISMCFTIFSNVAFEYPNGLRYSYRQEFITMNNFRNYKKSSDTNEQTKQEQIFADQLNQLKNTILNEYVQ